MCVVFIRVGWEIKTCLLWRKLLESHEPERPEYVFVFLLVFSTSRWRLPEWNVLALGLLPSLRERGRATSRTIALWRAHRLHRWVKYVKANFFGEYCHNTPFWESPNTTMGWDPAVCFVYISHSARDQCKWCPPCAALMRRFYTALARPQYRWQCPKRIMSTFHG